jgi:hypothetical protein
MATAGYLSKLYCTTGATNPSSADLVGGIQSLSWNPSRAELDTGILGEAFTNAILGKSSNKPTITALFTPADTGQARMITAFGSGDTVYLHYDPAGTGACYRVGIKVSGWAVKSDQAGLVTVDFTFVSATAMDTSTVS